MHVSIKMLGDIIREDKLSRLYINERRVRIWLVHPMVRLVFMRDAKTTDICSSARIMTFQSNKRLERGNLYIISQDKSHELAQD